MKYLLLLIYTGPRSQSYPDWEIFDTLEEAQKRVGEIRKQTEQYAQFPTIMGPMLINHIILEVRPVTA